jgi:hypothetical protein
MAHNGQGRPEWSGPVPKRPTTELGTGTRNETTKPKGKDTRYDQSFAQRLALPTP